MNKKTRSDIINELKDTTIESDNYLDMLNKIASYIIKNYKLKKIVTITTIKDN
jgi:hypothetical protein